jgi:hypothetical protein
MYSLQTSQTAQSGATGATTVPFVNNAELILGSPDTDLEGSGGIAGANPNATTDANASTAQTPAQQAAAAASSSGQSAIIWVSVAGILVAILLALKGKISA